VQKRKNIAFVINSLGRGGAEKVILFLCKYFANNYFCVSLILIKPEVNYVVPKNINVILLQKKNTSQLVTFAKSPIILYRLHKCLKEKRINKIISFLFYANVICCAYKVFNKTLKLVISERCIPCATYKNGTFKGLVRKILVHLYNFSDSAIAISDAVKTSLSCECKKLKIHVIHNPCVYKPRVHSIQRQAKGNSILLAARLHEEKNIVLALSAMKILRKYKSISLSIYGVGPDVDKVKRIIAENKLNSSVQLKGWTSKFEDVIKKHRLCISTSLSEAFGNSIVECACFGLPIIAMKNSGGPDEILENGRLGILIRKNCAEELAAAIKKILFNKSLYQHYSDASLKISKKYSIDEIGRKYIQALEK